LRIGTLGKRETIPGSWSLLGRLRRVSALKGQRVCGLYALDGERVTLRVDCDVQSSDVSGVLSAPNG
jgi:hypothetical protein